MKQRIVFSLIMSFFLALLMTCWVTFLNLGFNGEFLEKWARAFISAWPMAALIAFSIGPLVQKLTQFIVKRL